MQKRLLRLVPVVILGLFIILTAQKPIQTPPPVEPPTWMRTTARLGEDVPAILARYSLYDYACNINQFFKLNGLPEDYRQLQTGKVYKLPVQIVTYNGKSIRSTLGIDSWQLAKRIENFNAEMKKRGLRGDNFMQSKKLWVPFHLLNCPEADEVEKAETKADPPVILKDNYVKGSRNFSIFGPKYSKTPLASRKLRGKVYYVVSGHGGPDVGAQGRHGGHTLCEDEYAYDVALRLVRLLVSHGATAYMIVRDPNDGIRDDKYLDCDKDEEVWGSLPIPRGQKERLMQRTDLINQFTERNARAGLNDQTFIEIHVDSRSRETKTDVFFYHRPGSEPSRRLAQHIHKTFLQKYLKVRGQRRYTGTVTPRGLFMLNETVIPKAVYIELGNIRNDWDQQRLVLPSNRQAVANWLSEAVMSY